MKYTRTKIHDVVICEPKILGDDRGYFSETFREDKLQEFLGFKIAFCQDNESKSNYGVLRGLHYQLGDSAQTKLVRVIKGRVLDVVLDIREGSPTFGQHISVELSESNKKQLLIPKGFAHGFIVLSDEAIFSYKVDNYYSQKDDRGIVFNDKDLKINWFLEEEIIQFSDKDINLPIFKEADLFDYNINYYE
jgi:dTDP-4-dehydrorhamnose 3,5-epimerase